MAAGVGGSRGRSVDSRRSEELYRGTGPRMILGSGRQGYLGGVGLGKGVCGKEGLGSGRKRRGRAWHGCGVAPRLWVVFTKVFFWGSKCFGWTPL